MGQTYAVWVGGVQKYAGTKAECEAVAANHDGTLAGSAYYGPAGRVTIGGAVVMYLGD